MYVAVRMLYREGVQIKPQYPPTVGQIISTRHSGVPVLQLWPVDWVHHEQKGRSPTAELWHPMFGAVGLDNLVVRGLEGVQKGPKRRWTTQKWLCEVLTPQRARDYFKYDRKPIELTPSREP